MTRFFVLKPVHSDWSGVHFQLITENLRPSIFDEVTALLLVRKPVRPRFCRRKHPDARPNDPNVKAPADCFANSSKNPHHPPEPVLLRLPPVSRVSCWVFTIHLDQSTGLAKVRGVDVRVAGLPSL